VFAASDGVGRVLWPVQTAAVGVIFVTTVVQFLLYETYPFLFLFSLYTGCFISKEQTVFRILCKGRNSDS
jgi:hypothetical protein